MNGLQLIAAERTRQIEEKGYDAAHDAAHKPNALAKAGATYAIPHNYRAGVPSFIHWLWTFNRDLFRPSPNDRVRELTKAGALIAAEIDKILAEREGGKEETC